MNGFFYDLLTSSTGAKSYQKLGSIQELWSGYGSIVRYQLDEHSSYPTVIVKHIRIPENSAHPRGWNTNFSHLRKLKSYEVETAWYKNYSQRCSSLCKIPQCIAVDQKADEIFIIMEDLDASGYDIRKSNVSLKDMFLCLDWLANFHATFMFEKPDQLWKTGTYWHLETRPDELKVLSDEALKANAAILDQKLKNARFQSFVHGDAKLANFCFSNDGNKVAAVDFQYVGGGCGMKDVAYFIGSCLYEEDCEQHEITLLNHYFASLKKALQRLHPNTDAEAIESEWRQLFPFAWTDFHRFIKGWSPGHWKINSYSEKMAQNVMQQLKSEA